VNRMMCGSINKCRDDPCSTDQGGSRRGSAGQIKDCECGVVCGASYALQYDKDFRDFISELKHGKKKIRGVKTLLVCRCDKSNLNICRSAGDDQVPCCDCPLSNWPDLCMVIKAFNGCIAVAISCKCDLTSRKHKEFAKVRSTIFDEKGKLSSPFEYLLILVPKGYLNIFKEVAKQSKQCSNIKVMRCYT